MFRSIQWFETLSQRTETHEDATSFGQELTSAGANFDIRSKLNQSLWFSSMRHKKMYPQVTSTIISLIIWFRSSRRPLLHCVTTTYVASIMAFLVIMGSVFGSIFKTGFHARHVRRGCIHWLYNDPFLIQKSFLSAIVKKGAYFGIVLNSIFI